MEKVYLVTRGSYSAYRVEAGFTTEEAARQYIDLFCKPEQVGWDEARIEEYELDPLAAERAKGVPYWRVWLDPNGNAHQPENQAPGPDDKPFSTDVHPNDAGSCITHCFAQDAEHAIKIASERRAEWLAQKGVTRP